MHPAVFNFLINKRIATRVALCFSLLSFSILFGQEHTVGLLSSNPQKILEGYTLIYPHNQGNVYLLNNCGQIVHLWADTHFLPGNSVKLMEDGSIFITKGRGDFTNPWIKGGGGGQKIEHRDWDNNLIWEYYYSDSLKRMHHDFTVLPNGNVIFIAWEVKSYDELIGAGRDSTLLNDCKLWVDHLIEIKPVGKDSGTVVWQWHAWDHIIQEHDATKKNYGKISAHPELINLNQYHISGFSDWLHMNSVDFNPKLNMLLVSIPVFNEVWMIDHSTTTVEAASHKGGSCQKGGDLVFRWGNPLVYQNGNLDDRRIGYQHDAHWMDVELNSTDSDFGKIMLFSNKTEFNRSSVVVFKAEYDSLTHEFLMKNNCYLPEYAEMNFIISDSSRMFSETSSSAQRLPNGNLFVCAGRTGYCFETDPGGHVIWEYVIPLDKGKSVSQGYVIPMSGNITFRAKKYSASWPGFSGRNLLPKGYIELNADTTFCRKEINEQPIGLFSHVSCMLNWTTGIIEIKGFFEHENYTVSLFDVHGFQITTVNVSRNKKLIIDISDQPQGLYFIEIHTANESFRKKLMKKY